MPSTKSNSRSLRIGFIIMVLAFFSATMAFAQSEQEIRSLYAQFQKLYRQDRFSEAVPVVERLLKVVRQLRGEKSKDTAICYSLLGELYRSMADFDRAEPLMQKSLAMEREILGEKHGETAVDYHNLGVLYMDKGDYGKAELMMQKALAIKQAVYGDKHEKTAHTYSGLGQLYLHMGDFRKAESLDQKALEIQRQTVGEKNSDTADSYNNLAMLYEEMGDYARAEPLYRKSLAIVKEIFGEEHPRTTLAYTNLGFLYLFTGQVGTAQEIFTKKDCAMGIGRCALANRNYQAARNEFARDFANVEKKGVRNYIVGACVGLGLASEGLGDLADAKKQFKRAIDIAESQRSDIGGGTRESFFSGYASGGFSRLDAYEGLIRVLMKEKQKGYEKEALYCSERAKSRVFLEMLATRGVRGRTEADQKTLSRDHEFQVKLRSLNKLVDNLQQPGDRESGRKIEEARRELQNVSLQYETFIKEVKLQNAELASLLTVDVPEIDKLQGQLDPDITLLEFFTAKNKTYAWLLTRNQIMMFEIPLGEKRVGELVSGVVLPNISNMARKSLPEKSLLLVTENKNTGVSERDENRAHFTQLTKELYNVLIDPLQSQIKTKKLIVVPCGALHKVPFSALGDDNGYLIERFDLSILPSSSVIPHVVSKRKTDRGDLLALGNPTVDAPDLPSAEKEVVAIGKNFPKKQIYTRSKATKLRFEKEAGQSGTIHLACHGWFDDRQPLQSGLLLAKEGEDDGMLEVHEVFGLDLRNVGLVVLSACETGLGSVTTGDDMVGLSRAFLYAGTPSLMATLWEVEDESTGILMERFYSNWRIKGMRKPEALRQAQLSLMAMPQYRHPYFWAGFELFGDWK